MDSKYGFDKYEYIIISDHKQKVNKLPLYKPCMRDLTIK
nr:MAG TPA: hypothetical protein [Caudoviricetes sp.]